MYPPVCFNIAETFRLDSPIVPLNRDIGFMVFCVSSLGVNFGDAGSILEGQSDDSFWRGMVACRQEMTRAYCFRLFMRLKSYPDIHPIESLYIYILVAFR